MDKTRGRYFAAAEVKVTRAASVGGLVLIERHFKLSISALLRAMFDVDYFPPNTPPVE